MSFIRLLIGATDCVTHVSISSFVDPLVWLFFMISIIQSIIWLSYANFTNEKKTTHKCTNKTTLLTRYRKALTGSSGSGAFSAIIIFNNISK